MKGVKPTVLLLGGAPGVGKSTVARALAKSFPKGVTIEVDQIRLMVNEPNWKKQSEHREMLRIAADMAVRFAKKGFKPVLVVDVFGATKASDFKQAVSRALPGVKVDFFALWSRPEVLMKRIAGRPKGFFKDLKVSLKINGVFSDSSSRFIRCQIDNTDMTPAEVARFIMNNSSIS